MVTFSSPIASSSLLEWNHVLDTCKEFAQYPLFKRVTTQWKEFLMLGGVIVSVISAVAAIFYGSAFLALSFFFMGGLNAISAFYLHQFTTLQGLEATATFLSLERERLSQATQTLEQQNNTLIETNQNLMRTNTAFEHSAAQLQREAVRLTENNTAFQHSNAALKTTCLELTEGNATLTRQVVELTVQIAQLKESSKSIHDQILVFREGNREFSGHLSHLDKSVETIHDRIHSSTHLFSEISKQFSTQEQTLGEQIQKLGEYFREISDLNSVMHRLEELKMVRQQIDESTFQLKAMQLQYAQERASLLEIQNVLVQLRGAFQSLLKDLQGANEDHQAHNVELQQNVNRLTRLISNIPGISPQMLI